MTWCRKHKDSIRRTANQKIFHIKQWRCWQRSIPLRLSGVIKMWLANTKRKVEK
jgi:hypothetical protein